MEMITETAGPRRLIWTRSLADYAADQAALAAGAPGADILHLPCVSLAPLEVRPQREAYDYAVLTSSNAVAYAWRSPKLKAILSGAREIYTHGEATGAALKRLGLKRVEIIDEAETAAELSQILGERLDKGTHVALPAAAEPAYDLAGALAGLGFHPEAMPCYATTRRAQAASGAELTAAETAELVGTLEGVVCFASPSAVDGFAAVLKPAANRLGGALTAAVIGPTTEQAAARFFAKCFVARRATIPELVATAARHAQASPRGR